ncbi:MAG: hypothetical protein R6U32_01830 [Candidatus Woesearchaeota archaeon]
MADNLENNPERTAKKPAKALALISSGIDSPVAAWLMRKRGMDLVGVHFDNSQPGGPKISGRVGELCRMTGIKRLYVVKHGLSMGSAVKSINRRFTCLVCRRLMFRIAERIAEKEGCDFIVTGENLGQVASQTLDNMAVVSKAVKMPILRPLLCNDKQETVDLAKDIGTYSISTEKGESCSLVPHNPATRARLSSVDEEEGRIGISRIIEARMNDMEAIKP